MERYPRDVVALAWRKIIRVLAPDGIEHLLCLTDFQPFTLSF